MMSDEKMDNAVPSAAIEQQGVPRRSSRMLDARTGFRAGPWDRFMRDATGSEPTPDLSGLGSRLGAQPVIDGDGQQPAAAPIDPCTRHQGERHAVGAPRNGDGESRRSLERTERCHQIAEFLVFDWCAGDAREWTGFDDC